ncbi:MAG TPA: SemiSWEET family transporter [Chitinophagaceae bacterium]|nr:SemiSWEET family transporter [Chitinophagaceae bacterium]
MEQIDPKWIGIAAGILTTCSLLPPLIKLIRTKEPDNVPIGMLVVLLGGLSLWIYYGILKTDWPIIITNSVSILQNLTMISLRYIYKKQKP